MRERGEGHVVEHSVRDDDQSLESVEVLDGAEQRLGQGRSGLVETDVVGLYSRSALARRLVEPTLPRRQEAIDAPRLVFEHLPRRQGVGGEPVLADCPKVAALRSEGVLEEERSLVGEGGLDLREASGLREPSLRRFRRRSSAQSLDAAKLGELLAEPRLACVITIPSLEVLLQGLGADLLPQCAFSLEFVLIRALRRRRRLEPVQQRTSATPFRRFEGEPPEDALRLCAVPLHQQVDVERIAGCEVVEEESP